MWHIEIAMFWRQRSYSFLEPCVRHHIALIFFILHTLLRRHEWSRCQRFKKRAISCLYLATQQSRRSQEGRILVRTYTPRAQWRVKRGPHHAFKILQIRDIRISLLEGIPCIQLVRIPTVTVPKLEIMLEEVNLALQAGRRLSSLGLELLLNRLIEPLFDLLIFLAR